jgi:hypothetical protein
VKVAEEATVVVAVVEVIVVMTLKKNQVVASHQKGQIEK